MVFTDAKPDAELSRDEIFAKYVSDLMDAVREIYVGKASIAVVGLCIKVALISSLTGGGVPVQGLSYSPKVLIAFMSYVTLVLVAVLLKMIIQDYLAQSNMPQSRKATLSTFMTGLNLIPAWGFKDCVAVLMKEADSMLSGVVVLFAASFFALLVMPKSRDFDPADRQKRALYDLRVTMASCMGLGVGFAMNIYPQWAFRFFGLSTGQLLVMLLYPPTLTFLVVMMQEGLLNNLPGSDNRFEDTPFFKTAIAFTKQCGNFWAAWAWHSLLCLLRDGLIARFPGAACWATASWMILWALIVLVLAAMVIIPDCSRYGWKEEEKLVDLVAGMNVAFAFLDAMFGVYKCVHFPGNPVIGAWVLCLIVVVIVSVSTVLVALLVEWTKKAFGAVVEDALLLEEDLE